MIPTSVVIPQDANFPLRGINTYVPSTLLSPGYSPSMSNVTISNNVISKRQGYDSLFSILSATETLLRVEEFETYAGNKRLVAFTNKKQYLYDNTTDTPLWRDISYSVDWTGDSTTEVDIAIGYDNSGRWIIATNGIDKPIYWNGTNEKFELLPVDIDGFVSCKTLSVFQSRLFLGGLTTAGEQATILWSAPGDFSDWTGPSSGASLVAESRGNIVALRALESQLIIYSKDSIVSVSYVGGDALYAFNLVATNINLIGRGGILLFDAYHIYLSEDGFYFFDGSPVPYKVSEEINTLLETDFQRDYFYRVNSFYQREENLAYWVIPTGASTNRLYVLSVKMWRSDRFDWFIYDFIDTPRAFSYYTSSIDLTYNCKALEGVAYEDFPIESPTGYTRNTYSSMYNESNYPVLAFASGLNIFKVSSSKMDDDSNFTGFWETPDYTVPQNYMSVYGRWQELEFEALGNTLDVYYSLDKGATYTKIETKTLTSSWNSYRSFFDKVAKTIRFKFVNSLNETFSLRWVRVWVIPQGAE